MLLVLTLEIPFCEEKAAQEKRPSGACQFLSSGFFGAVSDPAEFLKKSLLLP